jgi:hypothetical protein
MLLIVALLLSTAFPSSSRTAWMRPASFRLTVGMPRTEAVKTLTEDGWKPQKGDRENQMIIDYAGNKSLTLEFQKDRLTSIRFELFVMMPEVAGAFDEEKTYLRNTLGAPKPVKSKAMLIYDATLPNIMVVQTKDVTKGLGVLAVRYYDPAVAKN